jgi:hypothetical protein
LEFYVEENAPIGSVFGTVRAKSTSTNGTAVHYRLVPGSLWPLEAAKFADVLVDPVFGYLMVNL